MPRNHWSCFSFEIEWSVPVVGGALQHNKSGRTAFLKVPTPLNVREITRQENGIIIRF